MVAASCSYCAFASVRVARYFAGIMPQQGATLAISASSLSDASYSTDCFDANYCALSRFEHWSYNQKDRQLV